MRQEKGMEVPGIGGAEATLTPAMRQYRAAKEAHPEALLLFRMGDFYELFFEDAVVAAKELQLTLTARDKARAVPMCGVPYHAVEGYVQRLLRRGFRVAICEQMEDPKLAKGVVRREVTRVLTPGTAVDPGLAAGSSCWLAAVTGGGSGCVGLALLDLSTGEFQATEFAGAAAWELVADALQRVRPAELLYGDEARSPGKRVAGSRSFELQLEPGAAEPTAQARLLAALEAGLTRSAMEPWVFSTEQALPLLKRHFGVHSMDGMGFQGKEAALGAAGAVLEYLHRTKQGALEHIDQLRYVGRGNCLELDGVTVRNLELVDPIAVAEGGQTTLLATMDACQTPMGKRLLRANLLRPAGDVRAIASRLDAVEEAAAGLRAREEVRRALDGVLDLERLLGRVALDSAGPRELVALAATLARLPGIAEAAREFATEAWQEQTRGFDELPEVCARVLGTLVDEPPLNLADGGAVREGVSAELDELRTLGRSGRQALVAIEERERARTGIGSLKVRFNNIFGYYLEVTKANARAVPANYERKQTLVNAERFTTPELKEFETKILSAQERSVEIERALVGEVRREVLAAAGRLRATARRVAEIDLLASLAHLAALRGWVRPSVDETGVLEIVGGRHPVVEQRMEAQGVGRFVPNSLYLDAAVESTDVVEATVTEADDDEDGPAPGRVGPSIGLITGPNMGGKSTYLRMAALLVILAQMGSFVPAERLRLGRVDRVFTRIGASDNVARGQSTFMVEMTETAAIVNLATPRSLVLLDEMGRGTATYDGLSLAWATLEHLHDRVGARTLFATHYHELTLLSEQLSRLKNLHVTVKEAGGGIVFLHAVEAGAASKSYGIEVARLAGLPPAVIERARAVLRVHERAETAQMRESAARAVRDTVAPALQMTMFTPLSQRIVDRLGVIDVDDLTPREALHLLAELQRELREST